MGSDPITELLKKEGILKSMAFEKNGTLVSSIICPALTACLLAGAFGGAEYVRAEDVDADFAPVTQEGRYETNENLALPGFHYELDSSHEVDGRQGIAWSEDGYFVSGSTTLTKYDKEWNDGYSHLLLYKSQHNKVQYRLKNR